MITPRLAQKVTQRIDANSQITFTYRGKTMQGMAGDTVASAMFANGVRIFSRSLKYHRPRGIYCMDGESSNAMVEIDGLANCRSENTRLRQGMVVKPQNFVGSTERDLLGFMDKMGWFMSAGFYYHMFHKPYKLWPMILKQIRKGAGIGCVSEACKYPRNDEMFLNTDVCVLGGGPAGMAAAKAAAEAGLRVLILEQRPWLGGFYDWRLASYSDDGGNGQSLSERGKAMADELAGMDNVRIMTSTALMGIWGDNHITAVTTGGPDDSFDERYLEVRCGSVVVATGTTERPLIFEHNDRPGVMQFSCAQRLANTWGLAPGKQVVFAVGHDLGLEAAIDLYDQGIAVAAVADNRPDGADETLIAGLAQRKIPVMTGWTAIEAKGVKGVTGVMLNAINGPGSKLFDCDALVASAGLQPVSGPLSMTLAKLAFSDEVGMFIPTELPPKVQAAGRMLGHNAPAAVEASGTLAGLKAVTDCGLDAAAAVAQAEEALAAAPGMPVASRLITSPGAEKGHKAFVCFDEDTPLHHIDESRRTGFDMPELAKRYTAAGTGPGQGGVPGHNLPLVMALMRGEDTDAQMPTTVRPPLTPVLISTLAGANHDIFKRTPLDAMQIAQGGIFRRIGVWNRARYFSKDFTCKSEVSNVRNNVGLVDVSTLGKFRLFGPDAEKALNRVYISDMTKVTEGKLKYSAMCNDDGNILDDGVVTKVGENEYYFTTSTGRAGGTAEWFRYHTKEEGWDFNIINLTDSLAAINLAGPNARKVLAKLVEEDISHEALPYMGFKEMLVNGQVMAKVLRVGFVGELSYELHVPSSWAQTIWKWLEEAGAEFDIKNFGLEAQNCLRMEKGHVIIGAESEIRTLLTDLHMGWAWCKTRPEDKKVGSTGLAIAADHTGRMKLAGIQMDNPAERAKDGSLIVDTMIRGHICTMRHSETLGQNIGLVLLDEELTPVGTKLQIFEDGAGEKRLSATVVALPFYDPEGERLQM